MCVRMLQRVCIVMGASRLSRVQGVTVMPATLRSVAVQMRVVVRVHMIVIVIVRREPQTTAFAKSDGNAQLKSTERPRPCLRQDEKGDEDAREDASCERVHQEAYRRVEYYTLSQPPHRSQSVYFSLAQIAAALNSVSMPRTT